ncbi:MAG: hypothetical protein AABZ32_11875 [Bacteroidota bacterium]
MKEVSFLLAVLLAINPLGIFASVLFGNIFEIIFSISFLSAFGALS